MHLSEFGAGERIYAVVQSRILIVADLAGAQRPV